MLPRSYFFNSFLDDFVDSRFDMKCDVYEKDGIYHIEADVPGLDKKDISVEYENGYLKLTAVKEESLEDNTKNYIKKERSYGRIERQFYVGSIKEENIKAEFKDGILRIEVPKQEKNTKLIEIK